MPFITATPPFVQQSPLPPTADEQPFAVLPNCVTRSDWPVYTVASGDTLGLIAEAINSTIGELASGNCLANPDTIFVGQQLRVPRLPATLPPTVAPTATPSSRVPIFGQNLQAMTTSPSGNAWITTQPSILLDAGVVRDADEVRYYASDIPQDPNAVLIGTDSDPFDGTRLSYTFNTFDPQLYFWAVAQNEFGVSFSNTILVRYDPTFGRSNAGIVTIGPNIAFNGSVYTLSANRTVSLLWAQAPNNAVRTEFFYVPSGGTPVLIATDMNPADGATGTWVVPANALGTLYAAAVLPDGSTRQSDPINVAAQ
jgi:hypothetical protein